MSTATPWPSPAPHAPHGPPVVMATPTPTLFPCHINGYYVHSHPYGHPTFMATPWPTLFPSHSNGCSYIHSHPYPTPMATPHSWPPLPPSRIHDHPSPTPPHPCLTLTLSPPHNHHPDPMLLPGGGLTPPTCGPVAPCRREQALEKRYPGLFKPRAPRGLLHGNAVETLIKKRNVPQKLSPHSKRCVGGSWDGGEGIQAF